jgi:hypothetical protein
MRIERDLEFRGRSNGSYNKRERDTNDASSENLVSFHS